MTREARRSRRSWRYAGSLLGSRRKGREKGKDGITWRNEQYNGKKEIRELGDVNGILKRIKLKYVITRQVEGLIMQSVRCRKIHRTRTREERQRGRQRGGQNNTHTPTSDKDIDKD